jgi:hypothetical protein
VLVARADGCRPWYDGHVDPCIHDGKHNPASCWTNDSKVPASVDWVSCDNYQDPTTNQTGPWPWDPSPTVSEATTKRYIAEHHIYPKLHPHQKVVMLPGLFGNRSDAWTDDWLVKKVQEYWVWGKEDPRVAGFCGYHYDTRTVYPQCPGLYSDGPCPTLYGHACCFKYGAGAYPRLNALLQQIGRSIMAVKTDDTHSTATTVPQQATSLLFDQLAKVKFVSSGTVKASDEFVWGITTSSRDPATTAANPKAGNVMYLEKYNVSYAAYAAWAAGHYAAWEGPWGAGGRFPYLWKKKTIEQTPSDEVNRQTNNCSVAKLMPGIDMVGGTMHSPSQSRHAASPTDCGHKCCAYKGCGGFVYIALHEYVLYLPNTMSTYSICDSGC